MSGTHTVLEIVLKNQSGDYFYKIQGVCLEPNIKDVNGLIVGLNQHQRQLLSLLTKIKCSACSYQFKLVPEYEYYGPSKAKLKRKPLKNQTNLKVIQLHARTKSNTLYKITTKSSIQQYKIYKVWQQSKIYSRKIRHNQEENQSSEITIDDRIPR